MRACFIRVGVVSFREAPDWTLVMGVLVWGLGWVGLGVCRIVGILYMQGEWNREEGREGVHCVDETWLDSDKLQSP